MHALEKARFFALWEIALEGSGKTLSEEVLLFYWRTLRTYTIEQIERAMMAHLRDPRKGCFTPKPADLVRHIEGDPEHAADKAWGRVLRALGQVGSWSNVVFDDRTIHAVIHDMGGWCYLCDMLKTELPFRAQEFRRLYQGYKQDGVRQYPAVLYGTRSVRGDVPVMLGVRGECEKVFREGYNGRQPLKKLDASLQKRNFKVLSGLIAVHLAGTQETRSSRAGKGRAVDP